MYVWVYVHKECVELAMCFSFDVLYFKGNVHFLPIGRLNTTQWTSRYLFLILIKNILHWTYSRLLVVSPPSTRLTSFSTKQCPCFHSFPNIVFVLAMSNIMLKLEEHLYEHTQLACCVYVRPVVILGFSFQY